MIERWIVFKFRYHDILSILNVYVCVYMMSEGDIYLKEQKIRKLKKYIVGWDRKEGWKLLKELV